MVKKLEKIKESIINSKKSIFKGICIISTLSIILLTLSGWIIYDIAKKKTNYTIEDAKEIALKAIDGDIVKANRNLELDSFKFEYEFKIKDYNNILREVTVDSNLGVITDIE